MVKVIENNGRQRYTSLKIAAGLLLLIFGAQSEVAMAQNAPAASQELTLTGAVDLALKQNLDVQIANIETATRQQDHVIARSNCFHMWVLMPATQSRDTTQRPNSASSPPSSPMKSVHIRPSTSDQHSRLRSSI